MMMSPTSESVIGNSSTKAETSFVLTQPAVDNLRDDGVDQNKSQCSSLSDGENYEWSGEAVDVDGDSGIVAIDKNIRKNNINNSLEVNLSTNINRNTWLRTSLRRTSPNSHSETASGRRWGSFRAAGKRQLGSNALASQLYRSSSFNSSGRSSTCDTADDMYSDASLEEDVHDLHHKELDYDMWEGQFEFVGTLNSSDLSPHGILKPNKFYASDNSEVKSTNVQQQYGQISDNFQVLQQQVGVLQDSAHQNDERYTRTKADNAALQARIIMLEEQLHDTETRYEEKLQDEQRRCKDLLSRMEREKQLQLENASIRLQSAESESKGLKEEIQRQRTRIEKLESERIELTRQIQDLTNDVINAKELASTSKEQEKRILKEHTSQIQILEELSKEIERLRAETRTPALPTTSAEIIRLEELHEEMSTLRAENSHLQEVNDELHASLLHAGLEQGRILTATENSLAAELDAMTHDENAIQHDHESFTKIQQALKEQQEVNIQLRTYIEGILLNIVENHPQLLEVKQRSV